MIRSLNSRAPRPNPSFVDAASLDAAHSRGSASSSASASDVDNVAFVGRAWTKDDARARLLLVGGADASSLRVRVAQSHLRHDMTPSSWSHVAILGARSDDLGTTPLVEVPLETRLELAAVPASNGVELRCLDDYRSTTRYPNIAVIDLPVKATKLAESGVRFEKGRSSLDAIELKLAWLAFVWGVAAAPNPLLGGFGLPCAAFVEALCSACEFDLTPGLPSRASCPEAIWQAALWWHEFYEERSVASAKRSRKGSAPRGAYLRRHLLVDED